MLAHTTGLEPRVLSFRSEQRLLLLPGEKHDDFRLDV